ncbi:MAG: arginine--tRNA ligase [Candidatus Diapherotrites archaeon]|nr:arginine--tRNA ligase [Candidatus Diapherotrites archaeon]
MIDLRKMLVESIAKELGLDVEKINSLVEVPKKKEFGDYSLPCFVISKELNKKASEIASDLVKTLSLPKGFSKAIAVGPYANFYIDQRQIAGLVINKILRERKKYGQNKIGAGKRVMVEYSQPNTNKPMHIGHLRNDSIGLSISRLFGFCGYEVIKANLFNDRGIHICQAMLAYKLWGKKETPKSTSLSGDKFVGKYYVMFHQKAKDNPKLNEMARELLKKWENKDKKTIALWKKMRSWVLSGFEKTYKKFGSEFDVYFFESDFYDKVESIIKEGLDKGVFVKDANGTIIAKLAPLPDKVILREDGTSIYISNDLVLTKHKIERYKLDLNVFVVASEQREYFRQLFRIFELLGYEWHKKNEHLSYGLVLLPEGKLKSREGIVIDAEDFIEVVKELAKKELLKRYEKLGKKELEKRALAIAVAAIKFSMLKIEPNKDIMFEPEKSISFEGNTGPYLQYTYARAKSIIRKAPKYRKSCTNKKNCLEAALRGLSDEYEKELIVKLDAFEDVIKKAMYERKPNIVCNYLIELCETFNAFYHKLPVLNADSKMRIARLALVKATSITIRNGLYLLGIPVLEEM